MEPNTESTFSHPLPELPRVREEARKHVIVIGAGAVGLSSALWLLRAGHFVTVCDPAPPLPGINYSTSASFGNACAIALAAVIPVSMPGLAMDVPRMLLDREGPLSIYWQDFPCLTGWLVEFLKAGRPDRVREIVATLGGLLRAAHAGLAPLIEESGASHLVRNTGCLYLYPTEEGFRKSRYSMQLREEQGVRMRVLDADEIRDREPALAPRYRMGVDFQDAYSLDSPEQCMRLFARAIEARGANFVRSTVDGIMGTSSGLIARLATGESIAADKVVVAGGAWSGKLAQGLGDRIPLNTERGYHVMYPSAGNLLRSPICYPDHGFYLTPMADGLRSAGTVELGGLDRPARTVRTDVIDRVTRMLIPGVGEAGSTWLGFRPSMPDSLPVIGTSPRNPDVIYAFGHGHVGLTLCGITGRLVGELVGGIAPCVDLNALRPDRF